MSYNKFSNQYFILYFALIQLCSCLNAGTHGSLGAYVFPVAKKDLQKVVEKIIAESPDIHRDTTKNYILDMTNGRNDTIINNHYNDGETYLSIKIENNGSGRETSQYTIQYVGTEEDWSTAKTSSLSIAYAYDENGKGGSENNGDVSSQTSIVRKKLIDLFERTFINRIKKELDVQNHGINK